MESSSRDANYRNAACSSGSRWQQPLIMLSVASLTLSAAALLFLNSSVQLKGRSVLFAASTSNELVRHDCFYQCYICLVWGLGRNTMPM